MYSVYALIEGEEICIYDDWSDSPELRLVDPQLELERNDAGSFTFSLPPTNAAYGTYILKTYRIAGFEDDDKEKPIVVEDSRELDLIQRMATKIIIYRDVDTPNSTTRTKQKIWEGRVISEEKDWYNCRAVTCEGDLAYMNDTTQTPMLYSASAASPAQIMRHVLVVHNSKVDSTKRFDWDDASTITDNRESVDPSTPPDYETSYSSTMDVVKDLVKTFGGVLQVLYTLDTSSPVPTWKRKLRWDNKDTVNVPHNASPQTVDFGKNLLDFKCNWDLSKLCTVAIPLGAKYENDGSELIGDPIDSEDIIWARYKKGYYLYLSDDKKVHMTNKSDVEGTEGYKTWIFDFSDSSDPEVQDILNGGVLYVTCRVTQDIVALCCSSVARFNLSTPAQCDFGEDQLAYINGTPKTGYKYMDMIDYKLELPHGTKSIAVCSYGDDIQLTVKKMKSEVSIAIEETEATRKQGDTDRGKKMVLREYELLDSKPEDWDDHYNNYYHKEDGVFVKNHYKQTDDHSWQANTFYEKVTNPVKVDLVDDSNYILRAFDLGAEEEDRPSKVYISSRAAAGEVFYAMTAESWSGGSQPIRDKIASKSQRFQQIDAEETTIDAGVRYIYVCSFKDGATTNTWPRVTINRTETKTKNQATKEKYVTVETATCNPEWHEEGSTYIVNQDLVDKYGYIERILNFDSITDPNTLCATAVEYLKTIALDEMTVEVSAIDLRAMGMKDVDYILLNDVLNVRSVYHNLDSNLPVTKMSIPLNKPDNMKVTIGETTQEDMSTNSNKVNQDIIASIDIQNQTVLQEAKDHATALIAGGSDGFIILERDESNSYIKQIIMSETEDPTRANNVWVLNKNGIGHFDHYPLTDEEYNTKTNVAITMDGNIVADYITSGVLRSIMTLGSTAAFGLQAGDYDVLRYQPANWKTNYNDYYHLDNGVFVKNNYPTKPDWEPETFYKKVGGFDLLLTQPGNWSTNYNDYYHMVGSSYVQNDYLTDPGWQANTYYKETGPTGGKMFFGRSDSQKALEFKHGNIRFLKHGGVVLNNNDYTVMQLEEFARIYGKTVTDQGVNMMSMSAKSMALNLDDLWVGDLSGYQQVDQDGEPIGETNARGTINIVDDTAHIIHYNGSNFAGSSGAVKVYLPKSKNADPSDDDDWVECYVNKGMLTTTSSGTPVEAVEIVRGFICE